MSWLTNNPPGIWLETGQIQFEPMVQSIPVPPNDDWEIGPSDLSAPINKLPADLLIMVLSYLEPRQIFLAAQICRWWREVSLSAPILWSRIDLWSLPRAWSMLIDRSKKFLLSVRFPNEFQRLDKTTAGNIDNLFSRIMERIRHCSIPVGMDDNPLWNWLSVVDLLQVPYLETLDIARTHRQHALIPFKWSVPLLSKLRMWGPVFWNATQFPYHQLSTLIIITNSPILSSSKPIMQVLATCVRLTKFQFEGGLLREAPLEVPLVLPRLKVFVLHSGVEDSTGSMLLQSLHLPYAEMTVSTNIQSWDTPGLNIIRTSKREIKRIHIKILSRFVVISVGDASRIWCRLALAEWSYPQHGSGFNVYHALIRPHLPVETIESLELLVSSLVELSDSMRELETTELSGLLRHFPSLKHLTTNVIDPKATIISLPNIHRFQTLTLATTKKDGPLERKLDLIFWSCIPSSITTVKVCGVPSDFKIPPYWKMMCPSVQIDESDPEGFWRVEEPEAIDFEVI